MKKESGALGPWHCSSTINGESGGDELLPTLQGIGSHDFLPLPPADGTGRALIGGDHLSESGHNREV